MEKVIKKTTTREKQSDFEYLIVGGYAVSIHGYPRYTGDLDIWINPTRSNAEKVVTCKMNLDSHLIN